MEFIRATFRNLVAEPSYDELTVSELCQHAKIGRKTFYTYYNSFEAWFEEILERLVQDYPFRQHLTQFLRPKNMDYSTRAAIGFKKLVL